MTTVTTAEILRLAEMTRIGLADDEAERLTSEMDVILHAVDQLQAVDTSAVAELGSPAAFVNILREDTVTESLTADQVLANAPERHEDFFVVPAVFGD